jgi:hypothetical protein
MGKMLVFEGMIFLQNYSTKQHPMYEDPKDPFYPDDNISLVVSINDLDMVVSLITFRTDKGWIRDFRGSVPVPPRSKLTIKLKLSKFAKITDYLEVRLKGYTFENQVYTPHYSPIQASEETEKSLDIQVGGEKSKPSYFVSGILDSAGGGITDFEEVATRLIHINELVPEVRERIQALNLDLSAAVGRCEAVHDHCDTLYGTMAVKSCPEGYERVGCCKCTLPCDTARGYSEDGLFCKKPKSYSTERHKFMSLNECIAALGDTDYCELHGNKFYTKKCEDRFLRSGEFDCLPLCPFGWPDYGDKCGKVGSIYCGMPSPWLPGDQSEPKSVDNGRN